MIPPLLCELAESGSHDALLVAPGLVYRRDCIDRLHTVSRTSSTCGAFAEEATFAPRTFERWSARWSMRFCRTENGASWKPNTRTRRTACRLTFRDGSVWVEIGECGLVHPELLSASGLQDHSGLAMGLRARSPPDVAQRARRYSALLRATDPRIESQMLDLSPYRAVSSMPPVRRDLSIVVRESTTRKKLGDRVRGRWATGSMRSRPSR